MNDMPTISLQDLYSQGGQDAVALLAMPDLERGTFVEVGCIDGKRFSNTLALEQRGWSGVCIEAHPAFVDQLRTNRPNSRVIHAAVGAKDADSVTLHANSRGTLSTLDPTLENSFAEGFGEFFTGFEPTPVPMRSLASIFDELGIPAPDLLSVDTEGCDLDVIRGLEVGRYAPRLILVEAFRDRDLAQIDAILLPAGYQRAAADIDDHFYFRDEQDLQRVLGVRIEANLTWTAHPHDSAEDASALRNISLTRAA